MIVKMKKIFLVTTTERKTTTLSSLRKLGVVHITSVAGEHEALTGLTAEWQELKSAIQYLSLYKEKKKKAEAGINAEEQNGKKLAGAVLALVAEKNKCEEEILKLRSELDRLASWGDFNPADFPLLETKGIKLALYQLPADKLNAIDESTEYMVLSRVKKNVSIAVTGTADPLLADFAFTLPAHSPAALKETLLQKTGQIKNLEAQLKSYMIYKPILASALQQVEKALEFKRISLGMEEVSTLTYVTGYMPYDQVECLKAEAAVQSWGLLITDPADEDPVPTLTRNPGWINIIKPVFGFLGTTPGYRELDISFWFLLFIGLFFAIIVGDGGYGLIMLVLTILARIKMRKAPGAIFILMIVMSLCTIIWGALSGTWFGIEAFARIPFLEQFILPQLASFPHPDSTINTTEFIWNFCFLVGAIQLTIARITAFFRKIPKLTAVAELGWIGMLWGSYFLIRMMLLQKPLFFLAPWLIGIGFALFVLFSEMNTSFFKGLAIGLAMAPLKLLNAVSGFADIISYIRLYAVGLASLEVAKAFNGMAMGAGFGSIASGIIASLILFLGHTLNIVMSSMSIIVHGVRLNMLEFSSHIGIEWSGTEYKPFKE